MNSQSYPKQKNLKLSGGDMPREDKVAILKESLAAIGKRIEIVLSQKEASGEDRDRWRRHLWTCVFITLSLVYAHSWCAQVRHSFLAQEG